MTNTVSVAEHRFEHAVTAVIVANSMVMLTSLVVGGHVHELLEQVDIVCLWFFAAELLVRLAMARLGFFHRLWNTVDLVVVVVALLPIAGGGIAVLRLARLARTGHLLRHVAHLRLARLVLGWRSLGSLRRAEMRQAITTPPWRKEV
jgi:Ion transport protein